MVPTGWYPTTASPAPRLPGRLPLSLWEGTLQDATDALVIRPALWEWDGDAYVFNYWRDYALGRAATVWRSFGQVDATRLPLSVLRDNQSPLWIFCCNVGLSTLRTGEMRQGFDRLLGLDLYYKDPNFESESKYYWSDRIVVITREKIEAALNNPNSQQSAPGLVPISLIDGLTSDPVYKLGASYMLYLRVERIP